MSKALPLVILLGICLSLWQKVYAQTGTIITLNPSTTYQTMTGWEAVAQAQHESAEFPYYKDEVFDRVVTEAGINRLRLPIRSGMENTQDFYSLYQNGQIEYDLTDSSGNRICPTDQTPYWRYVRYMVVNDNNDPFLLEPDPAAPTDPSKFKGIYFTDLDFTIDNLVVPLRQNLAAQGEQLYVSLNYVAYTKQICDIYGPDPNTNDDTYIHVDATNDPEFEEYAEFMEAIFLHMERKYGFVPDAIKIVNEPNLIPQWGPNSYVWKALISTGKRLNARGYYPDLLAPAGSIMTNSISRFNFLTSGSDPTKNQVLPYLSEFAYHCYGSKCKTDDMVLSQAGSIGLNNNLATSNLEWWNNQNDYTVVHKGIKLGRNSAYQHGVIAGSGNPDASMTLYRVDTSNPTNPNVQINRKSQYGRQYYLFIRNGATRISATTPSCTDTQFCSSLDPVAFINPDGTHVVVVRNPVNSNSDFSVQGLPAGTYGIKYTTGDGTNTPTAYNVDLPDQTIIAGQTLTTSIPKTGIITIYGKTSDPNLPSPTTQPPSPTPNPLDLDGDSDVDIYDYLLLITNFPPSTIFDFNTLITNL